MTEHLPSGVLAHYVAIAMGRDVPVELTLRNGATVSGRVLRREEVQTRDECGLEFILEGHDFGVHLADLVGIKRLPR